MTLTIKCTLCVFLLVDLLGISSLRLGFKVAVYNWKTCRHSGINFRIIRNISVQECILECRLRARCKAVKFKQIKRICLLFDKELTLKEPKQYTHCVIIHMSDVKDTTYFPEFCQTCSTEQRCDIQSQRCVTEECARLTSKGNTTIFGNMYSVGSTVEHVPSYCSDLGSYYRKEARCIVGGHWVFDVANFLNWCFKLEESIYFIAHAKTYENGKQYCSSHGAHLIQFENEKEQTSFIHYANNNLDMTKWQTHAACWWLGITDAEVEGTWKYSNTNQEIVFKKWRNGEPNNVGNEDCAMIFGVLGEWLDYSCSAKCGIVCEK